MNKRIVLGVAALIALLTVSAWLVNNQFSSLQNQVADMQTQNNEFQRQLSELQDQVSELELENREKQDRLTDFTFELAKTRHLRVKLVGFQWSSSSPIGGLRMDNTFIITVCNEDVIPVSGLTLTVTAVHEDRGTQIGEAGVTRIGRLNAAETYEISGWVATEVGTSLRGAVYVVTLRIGEKVLDEETFKLS
jgi:hypothetical protein